MGLDYSYTYGILQRWRNMMDERCTVIMPVSRILFSNSALLECEDGHCCLCSVHRSVGRGASWSYSRTSAAASLL